jgi:hypothetical protein
MNRRDLVLAVLAGAGGRPFTPVQLQKAVFVVTRNVPRLIDAGPGFTFQPYDYGPFDSDVYDEARTLAVAGEAVIAPAATGRWNTYAASDAGLARGTQILGGLDEATRKYLTDISAWVRSQSFSGLVKSIYAAYPDMKAKSIFRG